MESVQALPAPPARKAALAFIFVTIVLDILALGIIIPVLPKLVLGFEGGDSVRAATLYGLFGTLFAAMQFLVSPIMGALSDRFGRRPVVLISNFGLGLDYILMALAPSVAWLLAGRVLSGICAASISTASAYIADVTPPEKRAQSFGLMGAAFGLGFVVGPALGGLLGHVDPRLPFWVAAGLSLANACYGLFILPESLAPENRAPINWKRANPIGALALLRRHPNVVILAGVIFLSHLAHISLPSTFVLYADFRYQWSALDVGLALAGVGIASAIVQAGLIRPIVRRLGERRSLLLGLLFGAAGFSVYGLAPSGAWFLLGIPVMALWGLAGPNAQALMTREMEPSEQGRLQGALSSLQGIGGMVGPSLFTLSFAWVIGASAPFELPGLPFLLAAGMLVLALLLATRAARD